MAIGVGNQRMILYRLLRIDENPLAGLKAKNPNSSVSVNEHVTNGSSFNANPSRYISCCKSLEAVRRFANNQQRIVKIDLDGNNPTIHSIIDLTDLATLNNHIPMSNDRGRNFANAFQEVLIEAFIILEVVSSLCLTWTSSADDVIRFHCYWYVELSKGVSFFEADDICASNGGRLAPFVDSWQYSIIENMRPYTTPDTFIGVIDIGKENTWTQLDGTKIDSSFTDTFDLNNNQPNGGSSQNCIVMDMEPHTYFRPDKTQDKSCFSSFKTTAMICYADKKEFCYVWMSLNDGKLREHCYWLTTKPRSSSRWNFMDALSQCTAEGGTLAPAIDEMQLAFIRETLTVIFQSPNVTCTGVWMGSNTIRGYAWNWNNDPNFLFIPLGNLTPEKCLRLKRDTLDAAYISCNSDLSGVRGAVCFRNATGQILTASTTTTTTSTTTQPHPPTTSTTSTTTTTTLPTTTSSTTTTPPTTSEVSGVLNLTYLEQIKVALTVDPKETSAFKATLSCAEDNRFVSKCMGYTGIAVISGIFVTILFLDVKLLLPCK